MNGSERALAQFTTSSACSQSVATAFADAIGMDFATVHRCTAGFGGGMGTQQLACGAITGGVFVISAAFGTGDSPDAEAKNLVKTKVDAFFEAVRSRLGAVDCRTLLGASLSEAREKGLFDVRCREIVGICAEEVERVLAAKV